LTLVFSGIRQGTVVHKKMIQGLLYASIPEFFDRVPTGRILNRVSKDLRELDEVIGFTVGGFMMSSFMLVGILTICVYASTVYVIIPIILFLVMNYYLKAYYMKSQRECVRLENISNSPIVSGFSEMMNGLPTIRAYRLENQFIDRQANLININKRDRMSRVAMECWFTQRLGWLCYLINISAITYCIITPSSTGSMAGLLLAYAFTIDKAVNSVIYSLSNLETKMISV
jgi:ABC-type multidrug transport system fused ATPase/permease subunit